MVKVVISGAGPAGLLLAQHLITHPNYNVHVFEKRPDPLTVAGIRSNHDRTFPMGIQASGIAALAGVPGLQASLDKRGKWMTKMQVYQNEKPRVTEKDDDVFYVERSSLACGMLEYLRLIDESPVGDSISSGALSAVGGATSSTSATATAVATTPTTATTTSIASDDVTPHRHCTSSLSLHFGCGIDDVCLQKQVATTDQGFEESFDHIVAADGGRSAIRTKLTEQNHFRSTVEKTPYSYRSFSIPVAGTDIAVDRTHGWFAGNGGQVMLIPVKDDIARGVYAFPNHRDPFADMTTPQELIDHFRTNVSPRVADAMSLDEAARVLASRPGRNLKVHCNTLTAGDGKVVLVGDAAHAVSASVGLGCNSALQDIQVLVAKLDKHNHDWREALQDYNIERLEDAHAVCEISDNTLPRTSMMRFEMTMRLMLRKALPKQLSGFMRPMPTELTGVQGLRFSEILDRCRWWTDRVKDSKAKLSKARQSKERLSKASLSKA